jgi:hypothetical protein
MKNSTMKRIACSVVSGLLVLTLSPIAVGAQEAKTKALDSALTQATRTARDPISQIPDVRLSPTAFTYQGQLKDADGPVNGAFDFQFVLYSAQTGGEMLGTSAIEDMTLANGMFNLKLDFGRAAVEAKESWLEIAVRPSGSNEDYTVLFPRQKLTPTPYAIFAQHEQWSLIGVPVGFAERLGKVTDAEANQKPDNEATEPTEPAAAAQAGGWTDDGAVVRLTTSSDLVGIGTSIPSGPLHVHGEGGFTPIFLSTGSGSEGPATFRLQADSGLFQQGRSFVIYDEVAAQYRMVINGTGHVGLGTTTPTARLDIRSGSGDIFHLTGYEPFLTFFDTNHGNRRGAIQAVNGDLNQFADSYLTGANPFAFIQLNNSGNVGIGVANPLTKLHVVGNRIRIENAGKSLDLRADGAAVDLHSETTNLFIRSSGPNGNNRVLINAGPGDGNVGIGTINPQAKLDVAGRTITNVLQITGGNFDFSEEFAVTAAPDADSRAPLEQVQPGMVVRIDETNPGQLIVSTQAYDRRVAGIISGAGGIQPGVLMSQSSSLAEGAHPVALTGRVYCFVDASQGSIEPGDLLTTSDTPGHAMKVTDHTKAHGAVIGKAMTGLKEGKGLVLVLVTLQ